MDALSSSVGLLKASPLLMHQSRFRARILVMGLDLKICPPASEAPSINERGCACDRCRRILAMADSMTDMFGNAALSVAQSQISGSDVAGRSGVRWHDIVDALRGN
ncbi:hypothetical protein [Sphingomonas sp. CROZ-RG-20F-R02-07]|uniref:hypothetical protein n=1 Tax=Sphingomonas sp. CROZ-RG-20F-R02-07 TaxID=2914832 RepID=UPI001F57D207|nr:hypothetical protein [Sphingomonas sp. CROZ-RG-20F-R02-07]